MKVITIFLVTFFTLVFSNTPLQAAVDSADIYKIVETVKKGKDYKDAQSSLCKKGGVFRGVLASAGKMCLDHEAARLFKMTCKDYKSAVDSTCDRNAEKILLKETPGQIKNSVLNDSKKVGSTTRKILCQVQAYNKLVPQLQEIANAACVTGNTRAPVEVKPIYNVLALDGGGIRGIGTATILAILEQNTGKKVHDMFDMFVGTSTGGLIAIMLAEGWTAPKILDFYIDSGPIIFQKTFSKRLRSVNGLIGTKYTAKELERIVTESMDIKKLGDTKKPVGVTGYNVTTGEQKVISSVDASGNSDKFTIQEAARATSAAPTYFKGKEVQGDIWIDGGVGANDPAASAFLEAKKYFPEGSKIRVISIGTGKVNEAKLSRDSGIFNILTIISTLRTAGAEASQESMIKSLAEVDKDLEYIRIQFDLPEKIDLADTRKKAVDILMQSAFERTLKPDFIDIKNKLARGQ